MYRCYAPFGAMSDRARLVLHVTGGPRQRARRRVASWSRRASRLSRRVHTANAYGARVAPALRHDGWQGGVRRVIALAC